MADDHNTAIVTDVVNAAADSVDIVDEAGNDDVDAAIIEETDEIWTFLQVSNVSVHAYRCSDCRSC